jgi:hypothetical protein
LGQGRRRSRQYRCRCRETYDKAIQLLLRTWNYHFEFLNLGYAAYLDFFGFLKSQFPTIPDQAIAQDGAGRGQRSVPPG